jgi:dolichol-phosphate mannosyltransferase
MILPAPRRNVVCVVTPCYNEEDVIEAFYEHLQRTLQALEDVEYRVHFIDDGSSDGTLERLHELAARDERVFVYSLSRNFGHQVALTAGLDTAVGDVVVFLDSDLQHPPELIPRMLELWRQGHDIVSAVRTSTSDSGVFKRLSSRLFYAFINCLSDTPIVPNAADFCLLSRRAWRALRAMPERHRFLRGLVSWIGFRRTFVEFEAPARAAGHSKYTLRRMVALAVNAVFSFSTVPIRVASRLGAALVVGGLGYLTYILARYFLVADAVPGWGSLICTVLVLGGMQLIFMGLIGEYLARVYEEAKHRPLYFFNEEPHGKPAGEWDEAVLAEHVAP